MIITGDRNAAEIAKELDGIIEKKGREPIARMVVLGMLAGAYIGFGAIACSTVNGFGSYGDPKLAPALVRFLGGTVFALGLILVIVPGSELFTGNVLMVAGLGRNVRFRSLLANWFFVYLGNFLGAAALAAVMFGTGLMFKTDPATGARGLSYVGQWAVENTNARIAMPVAEAFCRGVLCNILVCLAVILALASRNVIGKILGIYFPIMVFVLCGFEHCIANMYFLSAGLMAQGTFFSAFGTMWHNLIPVTLGNIAGGMVLVLMHPGRWKRLGNLVGGAQEENGDGHDTQVLPTK